MSDKLRAEWFWTDRWRSSSAFLLPMEARGLYREMLTAAWTLGAWLPNDHEAIRMYTGCLPEVWKRCWPLIEAKWKQEGSKIYNETQREVFNQCLTLSEKRALAGSRGGKASAKKRSKRQANAEATPQANLQQTNPPSPSPSKDKDLTPTDGNGTVRRKRRTSVGYTAEFETFWKAYSSRRREGKGKAFERWQKDKGKMAPARDTPKEVAEAAAAWAAHWDRIGTETRHIPHPATWLSDRRWEDDLPTNNSGPHLTDASRRSVDAANAWLLRQENSDG